MDNDLIYIYKIKQGDVTAFSYLVDKYKDMAYNIAYNITRNKLDAEEVTQDAFLKVYRSINEFKGRAKFSTWLYSVVRNTAVSKGRKKKLETISIDENIRFTEEFDTKNTQDQISLMNIEDQRNYINKSLKKLNEEDRIIISLYYLESHKLSEISEITNINENNIKIRLYRARKMIYQELERMLQKDFKSIL